MLVDRLNNAQQTRPSALVFLSWSNQSPLCSIALLQTDSAWLWQSIILCSRYTPSTMHSCAQRIRADWFKTNVSRVRLLPCGYVALEFHPSPQTGISNGILMCNVPQKYPLAKTVYIVQISLTFFISRSCYERDFADWALCVFFFHAWEKN